MGVAVLANKASGHFGRTGQNGACLCGKPAVCNLAALHKLGMVAEPSQDLDVTNLASNATNITFQLMMFELMMTLH